MKEQKILDKFCRKLVAMDMDIFGLRGMAKDADPDKKSDWITMNGTHIKVGEGETPQEAGKKFAAKKESERASSSPKPGKSGSAKSNLTPTSEEKRQKLIQYYDNIIKSGIDSPERNEITRQQVEMLKNAKNENDITRAVQWPNYADTTNYEEYSGLSEKKFYDLENETSAGTEQTVEQKIAGNFWTRKDEMKNDLEERGFTVHEINDEYADIEDANGKPYVVRLGKANNTIYPESISPADNDDNDWVHPDTYGAANPGRNDEDNWTHEDPWKDHGIMENSNERRVLHNEKKPSSHKDFVKALHDNLSDDIYKKNKAYQAEKDPQRKALIKLDLDNATKVLDYLWKNGGDIDDATMKTIWDKFDNYWKSSGKINDKLNPMFFGE